MPQAPVPHPTLTDDVKAQAQKNFDALRRLVGTLQAQVADLVAGGGGGSYTDEQAQDAVGGILTDTSTVDFTYDDAGNAIKADVLTGGLSSWLTSSVTTLLTSLGIRKTRTVVQAATTAALAGSPTYANGSSGVGATLTKGSNGAFPTTDGVAAALNNLYLVKDQSSQLQNGVYKLTQVGDASHPWILTRDTNFDQSADFISGDEIYVQAGTGNASTIWAANNTGSITMGTTAIVYKQVGGLSIPDGTAAAPAMPFQLDPDTGPFRAGNNTYGISVGGTERFRVNAAGIAITGSVTPTGGLNNGLGQLVAGAQSLVIGTTPGVLEIGSPALIELYLPQITWSRTNTPVCKIKDPQNILTELKIHPFVGVDFSGTDHNSINEGYGSEGAWDDGIGGTGPGGQTYVSLTDAGCEWELTYGFDNPGISGGVGGWVLNKLASGGYS